MTSTQYFLSKGSHPNGDGRCAMEWVAYLAGEPHSDQSVCVSAVLKTFCISFNDDLPDDRRQRLRPYLARTIGTAGDGLDEERAWMAMDWLIRTYTPSWLSFAATRMSRPALEVIAERLRTMPPVLATENLARAMDDLGRARSEAAAARDAARATAWAAAAAWAAAWAAAGVAAGAAARDALQPTVDALQESAFDLLDRMLPKEILQLPVAVDADAVCAPA